MTFVGGQPLDDTPGPGFLTLDEFISFVGALATLPPQPSATPSGAVILGIPPADIPFSGTRNGSEREPNGHSELSDGDR